MIYKVVRKFDDVYRSCCVYYPNALEYRYHIPTFPKIPNSKIFCFDSVDAAIHWAEYHGWWVARRRCIVRGVGTGVIPQFSVPLTRSEIRKFWAGVTDLYECANIYPGALMCESFTVIDEVAWPSK